jgi:hypothetical protein
MFRSLVVALIALLSFTAVTTQAHAQGYIFNQLAGWHGIANGNPSLVHSLGIAQGDFNGDGRLDFAVIDDFNGNCFGTQTYCYEIAIHLAQPDGSYTLANSFLIPGDGAYSNGYANSLAVADVNGDGKLDLVYVAQYNATAGYPNMLVVQYGNGDGTFQNPIQSVTPSVNPTSVVLGDFNKDGKLDAAVTDSSVSDVYVHIANSDGTFQAGVPYALKGVSGSCSASQVITADFRKVGKLDLAVGCAYNGETGTDVLLGNGDGTFASAVLYSAGASGIAAADMNNDGKLDLIVTGPPGNDVSVLIGKGDGTFKTTPISTPVSGNIAGSIVVADLNGDGKLDVAMSGGWTGVLVLLGNGLGGFKSPSYAYGNAQGESFLGLLVGDYNLDGKPDLAAVSYIETGESFSILTNNGDGTFGSESDLLAGYGPQQVVTGDFNGDGKLDLAVSGYSTGGSASIVGIYLGKGTGAFASPVAYPVGNNPGAMVAADFNHDGKLDLAVVNNNDNTVSILLGNGNGTFAPQVTYAIGAQGGSGVPNAIAAADLNKDGKLDLVISDTADTNITVLLGNGDGTFKPATFWSTGQTVNTGVAIADFNGDGKLDIAVASLYPGSLGGQVALFFGNGDGTFQPATYLNPPTGVSNYQVLSVAASDLRGNGISDLLVTNGNSYPGGGFFVYPGNGDGTFGAPIPNYGNAGYAIQFADFNGDGKLDVAFAGTNSYTGISLGNGDGTFQPQMMYQVPHRDANIFATSVAVGDFNHDGSPDLAVASGNVGNNGFLTIILSNPVAVFSASNLNFGTVKVGSSTPLSLTVTDQSPTKLTIKSVTITGPAATDYSQTNSCGKKVAPHGNCTVTVTFKPGVTGARNATLNFADSSVGKTRTVPLLGVGN